MSAEHPLRPSNVEEATLWDVVSTVPDPEIPVVSIADLGILRAVGFEGSTPVVTITPTYSGCPAMGHIAADIAAAVTKSGYPPPRIDTVLEPAWTTDWMTQRGRSQLEDYGIAPPQKTRAGQGPITLELSLKCPRCGSFNTRKLSHFGSTSCKALYSCRDCLEPFDYFKAH